MGTSIVLTEIGPKDAYHGFGVEGLVGELVDRPHIRPQAREWQDEHGVTWHTIYIRVNPLSAMLLGHRGMITVGPVCFYQVHYRAFALEKGVSDAEA
jgi:hypothetical protein